MEVFLESSSGVNFYLSFHFKYGFKIHIDFQPSILIFSCLTVSGRYDHISNKIFFWLYWKFHIT
jgi:hypothetical protein